MRGERRATVSKSAGAPLELTDADVARWRAKILVTDTCAVWMGAVGRDGYGRFALRVDGVPRTVTPHQVAATLAARDGDGPPVSAGTTILHDCDFRLCCTTSPGHVRVSSQAENMRQAAARGRAVGPRPGHVDVRGPVGVARAVQTALRDSPDRSRSGLSLLLAQVRAAGDPLARNLTLF